MENCKKCGNPLEMFWCEECESSNESPTCLQCGKDSAKLDTEYHKGCSEEEKFYYTKDKSCLYCEIGVDRPSEHFICGACGVGMCEKCYNYDMDHTEHCFDYDESLSDNPKLANFIAMKTGTNYGYMCYECIDQLEKELLTLEKQNGKSNNKRNRLYY